MQIFEEVQYEYVLEIFTSFTLLLLLLLLLLLSLITGTCAKFYVFVTVHFCIIL